jgi:autotransporter-associated beta strand protein
LPASPIAGFNDGGVTKDGSATLTLTRANTYLGDTEVLGGTLNIGTVASPATPWLADGADVYLTTGSQLALNFPNAHDTDTIRSLYIDNVLQAAGTWGASGAAHTSSLLGGNGWLNVTTGAGSGASLSAVPEPASLTLIMVALVVAGTLRRRR